MMPYFFGFLKMQLKNMNNPEYFLSIDETKAVVEFNTRSLSGAKQGLAELKRRRRLVSIRRKERMAKLRENRSTYWGTREISRSLHGGWFSEMIQTWMRLSAYSKTSKNDFEIAHIDRILVAIDRAILNLETEISKLKA